MALEAAELGTWEYDFATRVCTFDGRAQELYGLEGPGFLHDEAGAARLIHPDDLAGMWRAVHAATNEAAGGRYSVDYRVRRNRGDGWRWLRAWGITRFDPSTGRPSAIVGASRDVTDQKRAEEGRRESEALLRESRERLAFAVGAADLGTFYCPLPLGRVEWSDKCKEHFWLPPDAEVDVDRFYSIIHPDDRERTRAAVDRTASGGGPYDIEYRTVSSDGRVRWVRALGQSYRDESGTLVRFDGVTLDVTDRKHAEAERQALLDRERAARAEAEAANSAKDRFLAALSHELRTPLAPVAMAVAALEADPRLAPELKDEVAMVRRNVDLEARLIDDLLDLSRVTSGKLHLDLRPTGLHEVVRAVLRTLGAELHERRLAVETDLAAAADVVEGDSGRLQQVLWNLLKNAMKFTPEGGAVQVRTRDAAGSICLSVGDTGRGMAAGVVAKVFEPFEQGDPEVTRHFGGLGLGLTISKALVVLHGGTITAESPGPGLGSTFTVRLPLSAAVPSPAASRTPAAPEARDGHLRLLVVEDHPDTARTLVRLLRVSGFSVRHADCVAAAVEAGTAEPFDVLVSDLGLPDGSGYDVLRELLKGRPVAAIAMSGYGMEDDVRRSREAGFAEHLVKPVGLPQLREAIRRVAGARAGPHQTDRVGAPAPGGHLVR